MADPIIVDKIMTLSSAEFAATLLHLTTAPLIDGATEVPLPNGRVEIRYRESEGRRLGGLLTLPQASVRLTFDDVPETDRIAFLARFDLAFQRGGG